MEYPLYRGVRERLRYESFLKNLSGTNDTARLIEVSALEDVRFREVSLYNILLHCQGLVYMYVCMHVYIFFFFSYMT